MATEIALEVKVNSGSSVNAVKDLKKEIKDLESLSLQAGNAGNEALSRKYAAAAGAARDKMADFKKEIKGVSDASSKLGAIAQVGSTIASGFQAAAGASALFGSSGKDLEKVMVKIQAATALAQGAQALANATEDIAIAKKVVLTTVTGAYAAVVVTTTGALKVLRIAMASTGIGALVVGVGLLIANFDKVSEVVGKFIDKLKNIPILGKLVSGISDGVTALKDWAIGSEEVASKVDKTGESVKKLDKTLDDHKENVKETDKVTKQYAEGSVDDYNNRISKLNTEIQSLTINSDAYLKKQQDLALVQAKLNALIKPKVDFKPSALVVDPNEPVDTAEGQKIADAESLNALLASINDDAALDRTAKEKKMADEIAAYNKEKAEEARLDKVRQTEEDLQTATQGLQAIQNVSDIFFTAKLAGVKKGSKEEEKILRQQFKTQQKMQIAMALINGAQAVTAILSVPDFTLGVASAIRIAAAGTATLATVAKIASTKFESSGGGGATAPAGGGGGGSITTPNAPTIPTFNPQGTIIPQNNNNKNEAVKAYVLEDDVSSTQNRIRDIKTKALYG